MADIFKTKVNNQWVGIPALNGEAAGIGSVTASAYALPSGSNPTASATCSGPDANKSFAFTFGIPAGEGGTAQVQSDWAQTQTDAVDFIKNKPDLTLKEDKSNKVTSVSSSSTDTQYPSAKAVYDAMPTALPVLIKYVRVDSGTDYTIPDEPVGTFYAISLADGIGTVTIHATSGTWWHFKGSAGNDTTFYPAGGGLPERTTSMTDTGGGTRTINPMMRIR